MFSQIFLNISSLFQIFQFCRVNCYATTCRARVHCSQSCLPAARWDSLRKLTKFGWSMNSGMKACWPEGWRYVAGKFRKTCRCCFPKIHLHAAAHFTHNTSSKIFCLFIFRNVTN